MTEAKESEGLSVNDEKTMIIIIIMLKKRNGESVLKS